jgi:hypothetical protein
MKSIRDLDATVELTTAELELVQGGVACEYVSPWYDWGYVFGWMAANPGQAVQNAIDYWF